MFRRVLILVEGQTEERFVKDVLQPHLWDMKVHPEPKIVTTKQVKHGKNFKGGITSFHKVEYDIRQLLGDSDAALITTMIDYYGIPSDFPEMSQLKGITSYERARELEVALQHHFNSDPRFLAYLMIHEFEALLFSKPSVLSEVMNAPARVSDLQEIRNEFSTPEEINNNPSSTPSARVSRLFPEYQKRLHGPLTTKRIGLKAMRQECMHFNEWCPKLENVASG